VLSSFYTLTLSVSSSLDPVSKGTYGNYFDILLIKPEILDPVSKGTYGNYFDFPLIKLEVQLLERGNCVVIRSATSGNRRSAVSTSVIICFLFTVVIM
jgi:hypothetical protein